MLAVFQWCSINYVPPFTELCAGLGGGGRGRGRIQRDAEKGPNPAGGKQRRKMAGGEEAFDLNALPHLFKETLWLPMPGRSDGQAY